MLALALQQVNMGREGDTHVLSKARGSHLHLASLKGFRRAAEQGPWGWRRSQPQGHSLPGGASQRVRMGGATGRWP